MSPGSALSSPVFVAYAVLLAALLVATGACLFAIEWASGKSLGSVWRTYRSWWVMAAVLLGAMLAGRVPVILLITVLSWLAYKEFSRATGSYADWWYTLAVYLAIAGIAAVAIVEDPFSGDPGWLGMFRTLPVYAVPLVLLIPILRNEAKGHLQAASLAIVGFVLIGWMVGHAAFLANSSHAFGYLLFLLFATAAANVSAFAFGKAFGRHKLRSRISPKKTWEGALGALGVSMAMPWLLAFSFPHFGILQKLLAGVIIGVGGQLGDLAISVVKRDIGIKDMGAAIPGHGGFLDRMDSIIFTAPLFFHMVNYFYGVYGP